MNTSVEESRQVPINNFECNFVKLDINHISFNDSEMENFYLDKSEINDSLLEQYYAAEMEAIHLNGSKQLPSEPFESNTFNRRQNICTSQSDQPQSRHLFAEDKSIMINCKTFCKDLMKPIASKIIKKLAKKPATNKSQAIQQNSQQNSTHAHSSSRTLPSNLRTRRVQFKLEPSVQPAHLNINSGDLTKAANNRFSNLGDIVYYNI